MTAVVADNRQALAQRLLAGAGSKGVALSELQVERMLEYIELFNKWNKTYNLSAIRDIESQVDRHLLDSLSVAPHIDADHLIDVGTGGGLPGIPLAILYPHKRFTLLDSNGKKARFLFQVKTQLNLDNVQVENRRVEAFQPDEPFDAVISRAFASLKDMTDGCRHLLGDDGVFYAMKGIYPTDELSALEKNYKVSQSYPLQVPREEGERHLLVLTP
ncbi:16S rRNA (guanine(527)-N(7))-methyltransferase RsmG [Pseudomaricurvus sp.]|uniref:16S rRNA (guanine(527)-N(7))-methyltransferase RsmG n=1 Tax=Pseudomaricurvus sp. TaxID=2004510 RepID=UPI003F6AEBB8